MSLGRLLQVLGLVWVTFVMVRSYMVSSMLFQFGGLAAGALVFLIGHRLESARDA